MTSIVKVLADAAYTVCFFGSGEWADAGMVTCSSRPFYVYVVIPLASSLPLWFRFMQTIKQYRYRVQHVCGRATAVVPTRVV